MLVWFMQGNMYCCEKAKTCYTCVKSLLRLDQIQIFAGIF
jgi:hypothetical protein